jgi:hypothetical protein
MNVDKALETCEGEAVAASYGTKTEHEVHSLYILLGM